MSTTVKEESSKSKHSKPLKSIKHNNSFTLKCLLHILIVIVCFNLTCSCDIRSENKIVELVASYAYNLTNDPSLELIDPELCDIRLHQDELNEDWVHKELSKNPKTLLEWSDKSQILHNLIELLNYRLIEVEKKISQKPSYLMEPKYQPLLIGPKRVNTLIKALNHDIRTVVSSDITAIDTPDYNRKQLFPKFRIDYDEFNYLLDNFIKKNGRFDYRFEGCIQKATKIINKTAAKLENNFKRSNTVKVWSINNINKLLLTIVIMLLQIVPLTTIMAAPAPNPAPVPLPLALAQPKPHQKPQKYHNIHLSNSLSKLLDEDLDDDDNDDNSSIDPIKSSNSLLNLLGSIKNQKSIESKISSTESIKKKKKHRTRSLFLDQSDIMPWQNPCGGRFNGNVVNKYKRITIQTRRKAFKHLRDAIGLDYHDASFGTINISDISDWSKPAETYRFLAEIKPRSNITLVRWHKKMQRYVGIISYLARTQRGTHHRSRKINDNDHSTELEQMFQASKKVLCAIETAINSTQNQPKIQRTTLFDMNTYIHQLRSKNNYINEIDLKIVKSKYINITKNMRKALNTKIREMSCKIQERRISSLDTADSSNISISIFNNSNNLSNSASNSNSKENNSMSLSNSSSSSSSRSREFKRSRDCQRILNKQNHQNNKRLSNNISNRNRKSGERSV